MEARDHQVLVVARIADQRGAVRIAREVLELAARLDNEVQAVIGVQVRGFAGPTAIHAVEVEPGGTQIRAASNVRWSPELRPSVSGDVMVEELPDECCARRVRWIVRVSGAQLWFGDEPDRTGRRAGRSHRASRRAG